MLRKTNSAEINLKKVACYIERPQLTNRKKGLEFNDGKFLVKFIEDDLNFEFIAFASMHNSIYFKPFRDAVERLFEAGITNFFPAKSVSEFILNYIDIFNREDHDNIVLTLEHLEAGLWLWLGCVTASVIVFIGEMTVSYLTFVE